MPEPKRRAGESLTSYNRRLVAYYANRRTLENAFNDDEEEVDIRDLTKGSPKSKKLKRSQPRNPYAYDEDRPRRPIPSNDMWKGLKTYNMTPKDTKGSYDRKPVENKMTPKDTKGSYNKQLVENKNAKATPFLEESASSSKVNRTPQKSETRNERDGKLKNATQVLEEGFSERADKSSPVAFANPMGKRVYTPGDYTKSIGNRTEKRDKQSISAKANPEGKRVLTPGDYTKNIGNKRETEDTWEVDTGPNRRPRKNVGSGKGSEKKAPVTSSTNTEDVEGSSPRSRPSGNVKRNSGGRAALTPGDYTKQIGNGNRSTSGGGTAQSKSADSIRKTGGNYKTINGEKYGEAVNVSTSVKGEKTGGNNARQVLEDGFRNNQKKEKRASGKVASFRGIRP